MHNKNRQWRLVSYPQGMPKVTDWALSESPIPQPGSGEVLLRALYLDVAPYMRGRISPQQSFAGSVRPGEVMVGGGIGEVLHSNCVDYRQGDIVVSDFTFGWQNFAVLSSASVRLVDTKLAPLPCWLDFLGTSGPTPILALLTWRRLNLAIPWSFPLPPDRLVKLPAKLPSSAVVELLRSRVPKKSLPGAASWATMPVSTTGLSRIWRWPSPEYVPPASMCFLTIPPGRSMMRYCKIWPPIAGSRSVEM